MSKLGGGKVLAGRVAWLGTSVAALHPGKVIQNYEALHLLGRGGMGEVWAGRHRFLDKRVAIKALHNRLVGDAETRRRFKMEAVTLSQLEHPNIVRLQDYIEEADAVYLVMEYVDGDSLDQLIANKTGPIPEERAVALFLQMLDGLAYAHGRGIVHRDIKPSNFMVTRDGQVKILDFGIAKALEVGSEGQTKPGSRVGTVLYMSPEQVRGGLIDPRTDVYGLGVTLFQMLTGQCPYDSSATEYAVYQSILNTPLPRAASIYPAVGAEMQAFLDKATQKAPAKRFQSCLEMRAVLLGEALPEAAAKDETAPMVPMGEGAGQPRKGRGARWFWGLLVAMCLGVGLVLAWPWIAELRRGPEEVARGFLVAVEAGDMAAAKGMADANCGKQLDGLEKYGGLGQRREVLVGRAEVDGKDAEVRYSYKDGEGQRHVLHLKRQGLQWVVSCSKSDLMGM